MKSRAIVMRRFGGPDALVLEDVELPALRAGEVRVRALASAVTVTVPLPPGASQKPRMTFMPFVTAASMAPV